MKTKKFFNVVSVLSSVMVMSTFSLSAIAQDVERDSLESKTRVHAYQIKQDGTQSEQDLFFYQNFLKDEQARRKAEQKRLKDSIQAKAKEDLKEISEQPIEIPEIKTEIEIPKFDAKSLLVDAAENISRTPTVNDIEQLDSERSIAAEEAIQQSVDVTQGKIEAAELDQAESLLPNPNSEQISTEDVAESIVEQVQQNNEKTTAVSVKISQSDEINSNDTSSAASFEEPAKENSDLASEVVESAETADAILEEAQSENLTQDQVIEAVAAVESEEQEVQELEQRVEEETTPNSAEQSEMKAELAKAKEDLEKAKEELSKLKKEHKISLNRTYKIEQLTCNIMDKNSNLEKNMEAKIQELMGPMMQNMQMMQQLLMIQSAFDPGYRSSQFSMFGLDYGYQMLTLDQLFKNQAMSGGGTNIYIGGDYIGGSYSNALMPMQNLNNDMMIQELMMRNGQSGFNQYNPMLGNVLNDPYAMSPILGVNGGSRFGNIAPAQFRDLASPNFNMNQAPMGGVQMPAPGQLPMRQDQNPAATSNIQPSSSGNMIQ